MNTDLYYLRHDVVMEPLFNQWYVCLPMIAPAIAPMLMANSHIKIMESYIESPDVHLALSQDPAMMGGPFINYKINRVEEIKELLNRMKQEQAHMLEFAQAIKKLDDLLRQKAKGFSLEPLYSEVPEILKGYVELVYDLNNNPSMRIIEGLLYSSPYFSYSSQSVGLSIINQDSRPFVLSTPRLPEDNYLQLSLPFNSESYDKLFSMKEQPRSFSDIKDALALDDKDDNLLMSFLTQVQPFFSKEQAKKTIPDGQISIKYFGHACVLIESNGLSILTDPNISYKYNCDIPRFTYADLPTEIDYVLITHGHLDHIVLETLLQLRYKIKNIVVPRNGGATYVDPSLKLLLNRLGFKNIIELEEVESLNIKNGYIASVPFMGEHHDFNIRAKIAYLININNRKIFIAADSANLEPQLYKHIHNLYGDIDVLYIGMECHGAPPSWFYGHLLTRPLDREMDYSRLGSSSNFERAIAIVEALKCKSAYVYAMGLEPWLTYILSLDYNKNSIQIKESDQFIAECNKRGIASQRLFAKHEIVL